MRKKLSINGFTIIEIIVTLAVLGIVIAPLMIMFITSQKINNEGSKEYKSIQIAQKYMEEIKAMQELNTTEYTYDIANGVYKPIKSIIKDDYEIDIEIKPTGLVEDVGGTNPADIITDFSTLEIINQSSAKWNNNNPFNNIIGANINLMIDDAKVNIAGNVITDPAKSNIKVILNTDATIDITNNLKKEVKLYVYNINGENQYNCTVNVLKGEVYKINNNSIDQIKKVANNILYTIKIEVKKGMEPVNTIEGTTIFKYKPK